MPSLYLRKLTFVDDIRINYDSFGETLTVEIMTTFIYDSYQSWIIHAIMVDMFGSGFITAAEYATLAIESSALDPSHNSYKDIPQSSRYME